MKNLPQTQVQGLASTVTSYITLWRIALEGGAVFGYTDSVDSIKFDDGNGVVTYFANTGYTRTAIDASSTLAVDGLEIEGYVDMFNVTDEMIRAGELDYAKVVVMLLDYNNLIKGAIILREGRIGEITFRDGIYISEIRGISQNLTENFIELYSPTCRANLFDTRCRVLPAAFTDTATVTSVDTQRKIITVDLSTSRASGFHDFGLATFTSGRNSISAKKSKEIKIQTQLSGISSQLTLFEATSYNIKVGDTLTILAGCDKTFEVCKTKFDKVVNYRGEPHVPGTTFLARFPDAPQD